MIIEKGSQRYLPRIRVKRDQEVLMQETLEVQRAFSIGSSMDADFSVPPETEIRHHNLFEWHKDILKIHLRDDLDGWIFTHGRRYNIAEILAGQSKTTLSLDVKSYGVIRIGVFEFQFEYSYELYMPKKAFSPRDLLENIDWALIFFLLPLLTFQVFFSAWVALVPDPNIVEDKPAEYEMTQNHVKLQLPPKPVQVAKKDGGNSSPKKGKPKPSRGASPKPGPPKPAPATADAPKTANVQKVRNTGLLALMGAKSNGGAVSKLLSGSTLSSIDSALGKVMRQGDVGAALGQVARKFKEGDVKHFGIGSVEGIGGGSAVVLGDASDAEVVIGGGGGEGLGYGTGTGTGTGTGSGGGKGPGAGGGYDINGAKRVIYRNIGALKYCYEQALKRNPSMGGSYMFEFAILQTGFMERKSLRLIGAEGEPEFANCIGNRFSRLQFPKPSGFEVTIRYPINFRSGQ